MRHVEDQAAADADPAGEMPDADLEAVSAGVQKGPVVSRGLPPQWGGPKPQVATVATAKSAVATLVPNANCVGGICRPR